jgi:hypothetical protein
MHHASPKPYLASVAAHDATRCDVGAFAASERKILPTSTKIVLTTCLVLATATFAATDASAQAINVPPSITSFYNSANSSFHVFYMSQSVTELFHNSNSSWQWNQATGVAQQAGIPLAGLFDGSTQHLFWLNTGSFGVPSGPAGDVWESRYVSPNWITQTVTNGQNLDYIDSTGSRPDYAINGGLTTLWDGSIEHVFYMGADEHVHEYYKVGTNWFTTDITAASQDTNSSNLNFVGAFWDGSTEHVFWMGFGGDIHTSSCGSGGCWTRFFDISANITGAPGSTCCATVGFEGGGSVFYQDRHGHIEEAEFLNGQWVPTGLDVTQQAGALPTIVEPIAYLDSAGITHIFSVDTNTHVQELYGGRFAATDITVATGDALPYVDSATGWGFLMKLTGFTEPATNHVFYVTADGNIREAYHPVTGSGGWKKNNITAVAGAPAVSLQ